MAAYLYLYKNYKILKDYNLIYHLTLKNETFFVSNDFFYKIIAYLNFSHNIKDKLVNKLYKNIENEQKLKLETLFTVKFDFIENL